MGLSPPRDIRRRTDTTATGRGKECEQTRGVEAEDWFWQL